MNTLNGDISHMPGLVWVAIVIFGLLLSALWMMLPFAVFGIKDKLDQIIAELKILNDNLIEKNRRR